MNSEDEEAHGFQDQDQPIVETFYSEESEVQARVWN